MHNGTAVKYCANINGVNLLKFVSRSSFYPSCCSREFTQFIKVSGIADGLLYMHQKGIAHGDIKGVGTSQVEVFGFKLMILK